MQASIIVPIISLIALVLKGLFGIEIGEEQIEQIADAVLNIALGIVALFGIFKTYQKKTEDKK